MNEKLLSAIITFALNIPVFAIVLLFWNNLNKRRDYVENKTGNTIDKQKDRIGRIEKDYAVLEERIFWIGERLGIELRDLNNKNKNTGN